jgi:hypothetical protein
LLRARILSIEHSSQPVDPVPVQPIAPSEFR